MNSITLPIPAVDESDSHVTDAEAQHCEQEPCINEECGKTREMLARLSTEVTALLRFKTFSFDHLESDASVKFHTEITSKKTFEVLWQWLEPAAEDIRIFSSHSTVHPRITRPSLRRARGRVIRSTSKPMTSFDSSVP